MFPVAGLGSRFLPATKASPKEMLPIVDKPLIQYAVEEAAAAGITDMIFITGRNKRAIEDHFDKAYELEASSTAQGKHELLEIVRGVLPAGCRCIYIRQAEPLGLGHAVLCAQPVVGDEPFAVMLADDLIDAQPPTLARMARRFEAEGCSLLGVEEVPREQTGSYGIVSAGGRQRRSQRDARHRREAAPEDAPSTLAVVGRYVLTPRDLRAAGGRQARARRRDPADRRHRRRCSRASSVLAMQVRRHALRLRLASWATCKATVELGLRHPETGKDFARIPAASADADMPDPQEAWAFLENSDLVSGAEEVQAAIGAWRGEIERELAERYPLVLVVMGGAVVFAGQLLPLLRFPLDLDYVHVTRYGAAITGRRHRVARRRRRAACGAGPCSWSTTSWTAARPCAPSASG